MIKVNLLSPERKDISGAGPEAAPFAEEGKVSKLHTWAAVVAAILTVGIVGALYFTQASTLGKKQQHLEERRARKAELDNVLLTLTELEKAKNLLDKKVKLIADLKSRQQDAVKMMDQLVDTIPEWVWLTSLRFSGKMLNLSGKALSNNLISDFINNLKSTGCFYDIEFPGSNREGQKGMDIFDFRINCLYKDKDQAAGSTGSAGSAGSTRKSGRE
jgi:type IV pilus assembly protein PilN